MASPPRLGNAQHVVRGHFAKVCLKALGSGLDSANKARRGASTRKNSKEFVGALVAVTPLVSK
jgi:hypothetical protein